MAKIKYVEQNFSAKSLRIIEQANTIIEQYAAEGFELTLRQLYYQFVSRDLIPNKSAEYDKLGNIISDARLAGLVDWDAIIDRTRTLRANSHWDSAADILLSAARGFAKDKWEGQQNRVEVWIEKDALIGVINDPCRELDVPFFSCRGYVSQTEMWHAAQRMKRHTLHGHSVTVLHLGDHDPSGVDMTRDMQERLDLLSNEAGIQVHRIALTMAQIEEYNPPPNPAKLTDSRCAKYVEEYGDDSWELDALEPKVLQTLVRTNILSLLDKKKWNAVQKQENSTKEYISTLAETSTAEGY
jgi:hypothetical protein